MSSGVYCTQSDDHGLSWGALADITDQVWNPAWKYPAAPRLAIWTGPGIGIQLKRGPHAGRLVIPIHIRRATSVINENEATCFYSDDHGATWRHAAGTSGNGNEAQVVELADGRLLLNQRSQMTTVPRFRRISFSQDGGDTWTTAVEDATLTDPRCQASILRYSWPTATGRENPSRLLFSNPAGKGTSRAQITIRLSYDEGATWAASRLVPGSYAGYSCLVRQANNDIGLLSEAGEGQAARTADGTYVLKYARFNLPWVTGDRETDRSR
jgi:sialidase-1